jgi:multiple sugar transport system substrate-binding protein
MPSLLWENWHDGQRYAGYDALRLILVIILRLACILPIYGCNAGQDRPNLVFAVGGAPAEIQVWAEIAREFSRDTGVPVRILRQPTDTAQRRQGLLVALNSAQPDPDVFLMDIAWLGMFAASGWLAPLTGVDLNPFFPQVVRQADLFDNQLIALPISLDVGVLYYRMDLLDDPPPQTWGGLAAEAMRVQQHMRPQYPDFFGFVWQGAQYEGLVVDFLDFAGSRGGFVVDGDRILVESRHNIRALSMMVDFIHTQRISPPNTYTEMKEEEVRRHFESGRALFQRNWPYAYALHQADGSPVQGKTGVSPLPAPDYGDSTATLGGWHVGVSAFSNNLENARRFALFLTSEAVQKKLALELGLPPGRRDLYADADVLAKFPHYELLASVLRTARPRPIVPNYTLISEILQRRLSGALARDYSPAEALSKAQQEIDRLMVRSTEGANRKGRDARK